MSLQPGPSFLNSQDDLTGEGGTVTTAQGHTPPPPRKEPNPHVQGRKSSGRWQGSHPQASKFSPVLQTTPLTRLQGPEPGMTSSFSPRLHPACPGVLPLQTGGQPGKHPGEMGLQAHRDQERKTGSHTHVGACGLYSCPTPSTARCKAPAQSRNTGGPGLWVTPSKSPTPHTLL